MISRGIGIYDGVNESLAIGPEFPRTGPNSGRPNPFHPRHLPFDGGYRRSL
jgi:hypothetical protein